MKKIFIRFVPLLVAVAVVCSLLCFGVSAVDYPVEVIYWEDYGDISVSPNGYTGYASLPIDNNVFTFINMDTMKQIYSTVSTSVRLNSVNTVDYEIMSHPFGTTSQGNFHYLDITTLPNGSTVSFNTSFSVTGDYEDVNGDGDLIGGYTTPVLYVMVNYYDKDMNRIDYSYTSLGNHTVDSNDIIEHSFVVDTTNGAVGVDIVLYWMHFQWLTEDSSFVATWSIHDFTISFPISQYYYDNYQNEKSQEVLNKIEDSLEQQGQTMDDVLEEQQETNDILDDMVNSDPGSEVPEDADKIGDMADLESGVADSVDQGSVNDVLGDASDSIEGMTSSFLAVASIFNLFADIQAIKYLLVLSLAIGFISVVLNLGVSISHSISHRQAQNQRKTQSHKGGE